MQGLTRRCLSAVTLATALVGSLGLTAAFADAAAAPVQSSPALDGTLMVAHGDNFATGAMVMQTGLRTAAGVVPLTVPVAQNAQAMELAGRQVQVRGSRLGASVVVSNISRAVAPAASTRSAVVASPRTMRIAVVLLRLPGSSEEPVSKAAVAASTFGASKSVANWYSQMSGGQVAVTGTVYGYYAGVRSCDLATELSAGAAAAANDGYVASDYTNLVVYAPDQGCGFSGMGWIGAGGVFLNGSVLPGVIEHELGHNLGLLHAGAYECDGTGVSAACLIDYGDPTDVMGDPMLDHGYNAEHKYELGWIPASEVRTVTSGVQAIALTAAENPLVAGSTELIRVRAADGTMFAIDRRASVGYDAGLSGVWIRQVADVNTDDTELLRSSALPAGATFTDAAHKVTIKTLSDSGKTASIQVCVGPCSASVVTQKATGTGSTSARNIATASKTAKANASISLRVAAGHGVAVGHTVIVSTYASAATGPVSCRDSRGNVYAVNVNSFGTQRLIVCSAHASVSLAPGATITVRYPAFAGATVSSANDFSGIKAAARVDRVRVNGANGVTIDSGATTTTTRAAELVFGVVAHRGSQALTAASGYTQLGAVSYLSGGARLTLNPEYRVVSATGAFHVRGALSSAQQWRAAVLTLFRS